MIDGGEVLKVVIPDALKNAFSKVSSSDLRGELTPSKVRDFWISSLREAFSRFYTSASELERFAVFGGKPTHEGPQHEISPTGVLEWSRWEFLHDVAVVEMETTDAAFARDLKCPSRKRQLPIVKRAIWQVESEIAGDGTKVAEDASKLRVGLAQNKLLVACLTMQKAHESWLNFLVRLMADTDGARFIALIPNYGRPHGFAKWKKPAVPFELYRCGPAVGERDRLLWEGGL